MRKLLLLLPVLFCSGCGALVALPLIDKMAEFAERMEKLESEKRKELRAKEYAIEGEIGKTEMVEKEVEEESRSYESHNGKQEVITKKNMVTKKVFTIFFADGREKVFGVPDKPLLAGRYYVIKYNGMNEIVDIEEVTK